MGDDLWNFEAIEGDEDGEFQTGRNAAKRDCLIMMVDGSDSMFVKAEDGLNPFCLSMEAIFNYICQKCASTDRDFIGVVVINTEKSQNSHNFEHIYLLQDVGQPGADRAKEIEKFSKPETAKTEFQSKFSGSKECNWDEAFWLANTLLTSGTASFGTKRLLLFTTRDRPGKDAQQEKRIRQKLGDLKDQDVHFDVIPLGGCKTDFWNKFVEGELDAERSNDTLEELLDDVRMKTYSRRSLGNIPFSLGGGVDMGVAMYNLIHKANVPSAVNLDRDTLDEVVTVTSYYNTDTAEKLIDRDLQKVQTYAGKDIAFDFDEVETMKRITPSGLALLGFKPISSLKLYHHIRSSLFIHPDEQTVVGSTRLFRALLDRCTARRVMPIVRITPRRNMAPRIAALLPQDYSEDAETRRENPPGFHAVFLPYADDIRDLSKLEEEHRDQATPTQIDRAKNLIKKLRFKNGGEFNPENIRNPAIEQHFHSVEAMALERTEMPEIKDLTEPNFDRMSRVAGKELAEFKDAVFPAGYKPAGGAKKRADGAGGGSGGAAAKTEKLDLEEEAKSNRLSKLTVAVLKTQSGLHGVDLKGAGKKADIIQAIMVHFKLVKDE